MLPRHKITKAESERGPSVAAQRKSNPIYIPHTGTNRSVLATGRSCLLPPTSSSRCRSLCFLGAGLPSFVRWSRFSVMRSFILFFSVFAILFAAAGAREDRVARLKRQLLARQGPFNGPTTVTTTRTAETFAGTVIETCTITLTPITGPNGEPLVREERKCSTQLVKTSGTVSSTIAASTSIGLSTSAIQASTTSVSTLVVTATVTGSTAASTTTTSVASTSAAASSTSTSSVSSAEKTSSVTSTSVATSTTSAAVTTSVAVATSTASTPSTSSVVSSTTTSAAPSASTPVATSSAASSTSSSASASSTAAAGGPAKEIGTATKSASSVPPSTTTPAALSLSSTASAPQTSISATAAAAESSASATPFTLPGKKLEVLPIGLGVFAGISVIALIVVALVTYERTKYRKAFRQRKLAEQGAGMGYNGMVS
ncbi:hypothetical protein FRC08_010494 [Ceratobasidium sp. 394]|nr:hypothetical protein FRC08_010494 [Ceratobasidium sp. 394]